jgi:hypothetical protein
MKTTFSSGVVVTSEWLNGAKKISFDGRDIDWHYDPLGLDSIVLRGPNGLDSRYVTLGTNQPEMSSTGVFISGSPVLGNKVATGLWSFGYDPDQNPLIEQKVDAAPKSFLTNITYDYANGIPYPSVAQKYDALTDADLVTKLVLKDQCLTLSIDNGTY